MSIVRENLMKEKNYSPYCGGKDCLEMPRTHFDGSQFKCSRCGWLSSFDETFINQYKIRWNIK